MRQVAILLVLLCAAYTVSAIDLAYSGNVSTSIDKDGDWAFRSTSLSSWDLSIITTGLFYSSKSVSGTPDSATGDAVWGAAYVSEGSFPVAWLAKWDTDITFDSTTNFLGIDVSTTSGFLAHSYAGLFEKNPSGNVVASSSLQETIFELTYDVSDVQTKGNLQWITLTGTATAGWSIAITFACSNVAGILSTGGVIVPQSLETIVTITNWPYKSTQNTLTLVLGVATGTATITDNLLVSGSSSSQVYFKVAKQATIDGSVKGVTVSGYETGAFSTYFDDSNVQAQLSAKYKGNVQVSIVNITFPAGAANIEYDPSAGSGAVPPSSSSASHVAVSGLVMVALALLVSQF